MTEMKADILIINGILVTMDENGSIIENGGVAVVGNKIVSVGPAGDFSQWQASKTIDAKGGIIMPGLINTHTHAAMTCFRGLADDLPLMTWLNDHIFPAESKLDQEKVYRGTLLACAEMILSGTTCFCDMYLFENEVAQAASDSKIRAVVGEVLYDFDSPNYGPIEQGFAYTEKLITQWKDDPMVTIAVEPHSTYLCAPELLKRAFEITRHHHLPLVIHVAETSSEVADIKKRYGTTPVGYLAEHGILAPNLLACHCVVLNEEDIALLKKHDVKVSHNPESNMKLASGIAPVPEMVSAGICVGIGTDGCASNNNLDLFSEMDTAAKLHKVNTMDPTVLDSKTVLRMCTIDAARALNLADRIGSIERGKLADIIILDTQKPHLTPMYHPISHLVYAARGSDVATSIIHGRVVMENRELLTLDLPQVMEDVKKIGRDIAISN